MARLSFIACFAALAALGCASKFDSASKLSSLRVLGVQKDKPYAHPGDTVHLRMLLANATPPSTADAGAHPKPTPINVFWFEGCEDPAGDSFFACIQDFAKDVQNPAQVLQKFESGQVQVGTGLEFALHLPDDIVKKQPLPATPGQPRSGSAFVFFAACAGGTPTPAVDQSGFPLECLSDSGEKLGPDAFVTGYTEVFAYDKIQNGNPLVTGLDVDGRRVPVDCIGEDCILLERAELDIANETGLGAPVTDAGSKPPRAADATVPNGATDARVAMIDGGTGGGADLDGGTGGGADLDGGTADAAPAPAPDSGEGAHDAGAPAGAPMAQVPSCDVDDPACFDVCTTGDLSKCTAHKVSVHIDAASAEHDTVEEGIEGRTVLEQMWVNYYADDGKLEHDVKLLNDATTGWNGPKTGPNADHAADLRVPLDIGTFHVWAVAHDNRGGTEWVRVTLATRTPLNGFP